MTTPTPDEQALTEQIARAMADHADGNLDLGPGDFDHLARAVLPVVKTAQREAWVAGGAIAGPTTSQEGLQEPRPTPMRKAKEVKSA